jgi:signal transduction histidine kinase
VLIERVIGNLLDNAFTHGQPPVRLTVGTTVDHRMYIEVEDCGPGIAPEDQRAMLQAFARGDASRRHPGLGLGLAIVQRVALRMGGSVAFHRSADGARAIVRLSGRWAEATNSVSGHRRVRVRTLNRGRRQLILDEARPLRTGGGLGTGLVLTHV